MLLTPPHSIAQVYYDSELQDAKLLYFPAGGGHRLLQHHYAFNFFADPKMQSFYKRFMRDYMRYQVLTSDKA